jgi:hypothetical protein
MTWRELPLLSIVMVLASFSIGSGSNVNKTSSVAGRVEGGAQAGAPRFSG